VGLVQRRIEETGIPTITLSPIADFTASVGAPRVAAIAHPNGVTVGRPGDHEGQRAVLGATLDAFRKIDTPGQVVPLDFTWPDPPSRSRFEPAQPPPIVKLIKRKPWLLLRLARGDIPG
jgi:hypothetical protein